MTPREILIAARELISEPQRWVQGYAYARTRRTDEGEGILRLPVSTCEDAECFCALGAVQYVVGFNDPCLTSDRISGRAGWDVRRAVAALAAVSGVDVEDFNDHSTHAEVLALFDEAIADLGT